MKLIEICSNCADYDIKRHMCRRGCGRENNPNDPFYDDCPLQDGIPMPQWIPVTERLPERKGLMDDETEYVLVAEFFNITENHYVSICGYDKDGWSKWDNFGTVRPDQITHWMPLPDPPAKESEGC